MTETTRDQFNANADAILDKAIVDENVRAEERLSFDFDEMQKEFENGLTTTEVRIAGETITIYSDPPAEVLRMLAEMHRNQKKDTAASMFKFLTSIFGERILHKLLHRNRVTMTFLGDIVVPRLLTLWGLGSKEDESGELTQKVSGS